MSSSNLRAHLFRGLRDGLPIGLGYFAVAFSLGITARAAGLAPWMGFLASFLNHASAGEYALYSLIAAHAAYWEIAVVIFITNMRYLLMGAALSQKLRPETPLGTRLTVGFGVTDEIFGLGVAQEGYLSPAYLLTAFLLADLMWSSGTAVGIAAGNILPTAVVSALSVAIYGMFLAIIIPPARKNRVVGALVLLSFGVSWLAGVLPGVRELSEGMRTILLTLLLAGGAAALFPIKEEKA